MIRDRRRIRIYLVYLFQRTVGEGRAGDQRQTEDKNIFGLLASGTRIIRKHFIFQHFFKDYDFDRFAVRAEYIVEIPMIFDYSVLRYLFN